MTHFIHIISNNINRMDGFLSTWNLGMYNSIVVTIGSGGGDFNGRVALMELLK